MRRRAVKVEPGRIGRVGAAETDFFHAHADVQAVGFIEDVVGPVQTDDAAWTDIDDAEFAPFQEERDPHLLACGQFERLHRDGAAGDDPVHMAVDQLDRTRYHDCRNQEFLPHLFRRIGFEVFRVMSITNFH